jgi:hypothetical protein
MSRHNRPRSGAHPAAHFCGDVGHHQQGCGPTLQALWFKSGVCRGPGPACFSGVCHFVVSAPADLEHMSHSPQGARMRAGVRHVGRNPFTPALCPACRKIFHISKSALINKLVWMGTPRFTTAGLCLWTSDKLAAKCYAIRGQILCMLVCSYQSPHQHWVVHAVACLLGVRRAAVMVRNALHCWIFPSPFLCRHGNQTLRWLGLSAQGSFQAHVHAGSPCVLLHGHPPIIAIAHCSLSAWYCTGVLTPLTRGLS